MAAIPVEDLSVLILDSWGITLTHELLSALAEANVMVILCDPKHLPRAQILPLYGSATHAKTMREQIVCSEPKRKRIWQQIVQAKIREQARTLRQIGNSRSATKIESMVESVLSGDSANIEGQAPRIYFPALFGKGFERDREETGINSMLNYGYAIVRAMTARALVGAGLHPALGVFHRGPLNPFNLADDAVEPLRPMVDAHVYALWRELRPDELTPELKKRLLQVSVLTVNFAGKPFEINVALERYAASLREGLCGEARKINLPSR